MLPFYVQKLYKHYCGGEVEQYYIKYMYVYPKSNGLYVNNMLSHT